MGIRWAGRYPPPYGIPDQAHRWPVPQDLRSEGGIDGAMAAVEEQLLLLAATLVGSPAPAAAGGEKWAGGSFDHDPASPVLMLVDHTDAGSETGLCAGELLLAPAFMSSAAEAQVEAALEALRGQKSTL